MLTDDIVYFFRRLSFTVVTTIDDNGRPHSACKGIVKIDQDGTVYLLDLYKQETFKNLKRNSSISVTGVDENKFEGYCLKGEARIASTEELTEDIIAFWENKITSRITQRVIDSIQEKKGHKSHPEASLPKPEYLIVMKVEEALDLTPSHLK